jgi:putative membrane protein
MMGGGMMGVFGGGVGGLGLVGGLLSALLTIGVLVGLVFLGIWLWRPGLSARKGKYGASEGAGLWTQPQDTGKASPREILQTRYARGELSREEYQGMLQDLA